MFFSSVDMMLGPNEIDIKDEPLSSSSNDMVGYTWFLLNILYFIAIFSMLCKTRKICVMWYLWYVSIILRF